MTRILLLGGTTEATKLAHHLAECRVDAIFSYAGRTSNPIKQPLKTRIGGFGGIDGLMEYLANEKFTHVIDATHPFAAQMSANVIAACKQTNIAFCAFERAPWQPSRNDHWQSCATIAEAANALPARPQNVFLAIGKQHLDQFAIYPQHHYLVRLVDEPKQDLPFPNATVVIDRGPFTCSIDQALMKQYHIDLVISKNSGGIGASAKLEAAQSLGIPVLMINRPTIENRIIFDSIPNIMKWLDHS